MKSLNSLDRHSVTRREFLQQGTVALGAAAAFGPALMAQAAATSPVPAIDSHIHLYDPAKPGGVPWPPPGNAVLAGPHLPKDFTALTEPFGVVGAVVIEANALPDDNRWVLEQAKDHDNIVAYIARLQPGQPMFAADLNKLAESPYLKGLRLNHGMMNQQGDSAAFEKDIRLLGERQLALDVIGDATILDDIQRLNKLAPGIRFIFDHLPIQAWGQDPAAIRKALESVARLPNVYIKLSNILRKLPDGKPNESADTYRPVLDALCESVGEDRVIYASNWPVSNLTGPYPSLYKIVAEYFAGKDRAVAEKFFWKNSLAAYRWVPRGAAAKLVGK